MVAFSLAATLISSFPVVAEDAPMFPKDAWGKTYGAWTKEERLQFYEDWFGDQLRAMREKPLWQDTEPNSPTVFRALFLPSFDLAGMVRVQRKSEGLSFTFKQLDSPGGYDPGRLHAEEAGVLSAEDEAEFQNLLSRIYAGRNPAPPEVFDSNVICFDGTQVVLEFRKGERYVALNRHECELPKSDPIRLIVNLLDKATDNGLISPHTFD